MDPQGRCDGHQAQQGTLSPVKGKRLLRSSHGRRRMKFCLRAVGVALFMSCPYVYLLLMRLCSGNSLEPFVLVLFPLLMEILALFIHRKGM